MAATTQKGYAMVEGVVGTMAGLAYPIKQSAKISREADEEIVKDEHGFDAGWLFRNHHYQAEISFKFAASTGANALAVLPCLLEGTSIALTGFTSSDFNGTWQVMAGGSSADFANTKVSEGSYKLRRYADGTQNTASYTAISSPS